MKVSLLRLVRAGRLLCSSQPYCSVIRLESVLWLYVSSVMFENVCKFGDLRSGKRYTNSRPQSKVLKTVMCCRV